MVTKPILYASLREVVFPSHTCLVLWDLQNALVNAIFNKEEFLRSIKSLADAARKHLVPLVYTRITPLPPRFASAWTTYVRMKRAGVDSPDKLGPWMQPGTPEAEIQSSLLPLDGDVVLSKHTASIFIGTPFENMMRNADITTILFTGISTEIGIDSSARDASNRGFCTVVVSDCVSSSDRQMHEFSLATLPRACLVRPSADIVAQWERTD
jgi:nicotinamidase-related amidase